jgi:hypothetical protein
MHCPESYNLGNATRGCAVETNWISVLVFSTWIWIRLHCSDCLFWPELLAMMVDPISLTSLPFLSAFDTPSILPSRQAFHKHKQ